MWGRVRGADGGRCGGRGARHLALVAYDVGGTPETPRAAAFAEPVRNATVVIEEGGARKGFSTPAVTVTGGGTVTVVNLDTMDHTVTSVAKGPDGLPLFDVRVPPARPRRSPASSRSPTATTRSTASSTRDARRARPSPAAGGGGGAGAPDLRPAAGRAARPSAAPTIRLVMRAGPGADAADGRRTSMWTYDGTYPGPTIRRRGGRGTRVTVVNRLPKGAGSMSTHLHGDHHAAKDDGQPTTRWSGAVPAAPTTTR